MNAGEFFENLLFVFCCLGCGIGCWVYGSWVQRQEKPVGFWSGVPFASERITEIAAYNRDYCILFKKFAILPTVAGITMLFAGFSVWMAYVSLAILMFWGTFGIWWLIHTYKKMERKYILS